MLNNLFKNNKKTQKTREKSTGRSMVEMLGVLAIIGVLSIGGISGYTIAMRRYKANEILHSLNQYAMTYYTSCQNAILNDSEHYSTRWQYPWSCPDALPFESLGLSSLSKDVAIGYPIRLTSNASGDFAWMILDFKSQELCKTVASMIDTTMWGPDSNCRHRSNYGSGYALPIYFLMN